MKKKESQNISGWSFYKNQQLDKTLFGKIKRSQSLTLARNKKTKQKLVQKQKSIIDEIRIEQKIQKVQKSIQKVLQIIDQKPKQKPLSPKKSAITILDQKNKFKIVQTQKQTLSNSNEKSFSPKKQKIKRKPLQLQGYCPVLDLSKQINIKRKHLNEYYDILFLLEVVSQNLRAQTFNGKYKNHQQKMECLFPILFGPTNNNGQIFGPISKQKILFLNGSKCVQSKHQHSLNKLIKKI